MRETGDVDAMRWELGRQLAALRREARLTQHALAPMTRFTRSAVSMAEIGCGYQAREFWQACDEALGTGGVLAAGADQIAAMRDAQRHAQKAIRLCPNCGFEIVSTPACRVQAGSDDALIPGSSE